MEDSEKGSVKVKNSATSLEGKKIGITLGDRKWTEWVREQARVNDILSEIKRQKLASIGHVMRSQEKCRSLRVTEWIPREGKRSSGQQKVRWVQKNKKFAGIGWPQLARNRVNWRNLSSNDRRQGDDEEW